MTRRLVSILLLLMATIRLGGEACIAEIPLEYKVKAGYLLNLPMFAELPQSSASCGSFTVCVIGETPLQEVLETMKSKRVKNRPVAIRSVHEVAELDCCQVLFIAASERYRLQRLLSEAHRRGIMTVSDMRDFGKLGGMVTLVTINNRVGYDLNLTAARSANISFGSQLLKLSNDVIK